MRRSIQTNTSAALSFVAVVLVVLGLFAFNPLTPTKTSAQTTAQPDNCFSTLEIAGYSKNGQAILRNSNPDCGEVTKLISYTITHKDPQGNVKHTANGTHEIKKAQDEESIEKFSWNLAISDTLSLSNVIVNQPNGTQIQFPDVQMTVFGDSPTFAAMKLWIAATQPCLAIEYRHDPIGILTNLDTGEKTTHELSDREGEINNVKWASGYQLDTFLNGVHNGSYRWTRIPDLCTPATATATATNTQATAQTAVTQTTAETATTPQTPPPSATSTPPSNPDSARGLQFLPFVEKNENVTIPTLTPTMTASPTTVAPSVTPTRTNTPRPQDDKKPTVTATAPGPFGTPDGTPRASATSQPTAAATLVPTRTQVPEVSATPKPGTLRAEPTMTATATATPAQ